VPIRSIFSSQKNISTLFGEVVSVNKENRTIDLKNGRKIEYDFLVIAAGAEYNYFGNNEWKEHAPGLKSIDNAISIRERILYSLEIADQLNTDEERRPYLSYAVIGGGPTGVEMAGAIAEIAKRNMMRDFSNLDPSQTEVYLIEAGSDVLNGYPESLSKKAKADLEKMGVNVLLNHPVTDVKEDQVVAGDTIIKTPNIIWAAGIKTSSLADTLGTDQDKTGRVKVRKDLSLPGFSNIFVIGDAAYLEDKNGDPLPALAPVALQQGKYVGTLLKDKVQGKEPGPFAYVDKGTMATIGRAKAVADIRGFKFSGVFAWLLWSLIHIFFLIGFRNRLRVFMEWVWHYITFKRGVRIISERSVKNQKKSTAPVEVEE